jgi:DNA polymerase (family 10)
VDTKTALEINSFPDRLDLADIHVKHGKDLGVVFCIGTDAHRVEHMDYMKYGVATARRGWLEKKDVINTYDLTELKNFFQMRSGKNG